MQITKEQIEQLRELTNKNTEITQKVNSQMAEIKRTGKDNLHKVVRGGQEQEVKEFFLWEEVYNIGINSEAGKVLEEKYKDFFADVREQEEVVNDINEFTNANLGFDFRQMNLINLIDLILSIKDIK